MTRVWPPWWETVRSRLLQSDIDELELTIDEIREQVPTSDTHLHERWWWNALRNPNNTSHVGLLENGLRCTPLPENGPIERIVFHLDESGES